LAVNTGTGGVILFRGVLIFSPSMAFLEMALFLLLKHIREKRICDAPDLSSLLANKSFLSECFYLIPIWGRLAWHLPQNVLHLVSWPWGLTKSPNTWEASQK